MRCVVFVAALSIGSSIGFGQELPLVHDVEGQPLSALATRIGDALSLVGSELGPVDSARLSGLRQLSSDAQIVMATQEILDRYCLAMVTIQPGGKIQAVPGPAEPKLIAGGWTTYLIKVHNLADVRVPLEVESPNAAPLYFVSSYSQTLMPEKRISQEARDSRFLATAFYRGRPMQTRLSGLELEYVILQLYSRATGDREAPLSFHLNEAAQDGFSNTIKTTFNCRPSVRVLLRVKDHDRQSVMAKFLIRDHVNRDPDKKKSELLATYPLPSRRSTRDDNYPDFFFQPHIYRADGEHVDLPPGEYDVIFTRGPEYIPQQRTITVPDGPEPIEMTFQLRRWAHLASLGWYSGDHHVHAAGCAHYESPEEGVQAADMFRQVLGEDLNVACVLSWGPCWYHQKSFFDGALHPSSTKSNLIRYDVEVSGFPSSHAGHLCLLRLKEDDYPGTSRIEEWPSWTLPILKWAKSQGAVVGYAHSGIGLEATEPTDRLPNYVLPAFSGVGANEYIVTVTHNAVDFISAGDTMPRRELNIWYHTLNCGFRTRISGETDFPCIYDNRIGVGRSYVKLDGALDFDRFVDQIRAGRSYVSDGRSHVVDFTAGDQQLGVNGSELQIGQPGSVKIHAKVAAYLPEESRDPRFGALPDFWFQTESLMGGLPQVLKAWGAERPFWHIERARIGQSRRVPAELIVNGQSVARREIVADGQWNELEFSHQFDNSSWCAIRIFPSSHTNPIFVIVNDKPIRSSVRSAQWCRQCVDQCWKMKKAMIDEDEREDAQAAYDHARRVYEQIVSDAKAAGAE